MSSIVVRALWSLSHVNARAFIDVTRVSSAEPTQRGVITHYRVTNAITPVRPWSRAVTRAQWRDGFKSGGRDVHRNKWIQVPPDGVSCRKLRITGVMRRWVQPKAKLQIEGLQWGIKRQ